MPVVHFNATDIAHNDHLMEYQLEQETGRKLVLDPEWSTPTPSANGLHSFLYDSEIEFILIKTDTDFDFRRIVPLDPNAGSSPANLWDSRNGEEYYIFKVDPGQEVLVAGNEKGPNVRYFRCLSSEQKGEASPSSQPKSSLPSESAPVWTHERSLSPWEAEDVYQERDSVTGQTSPPEHLAEVARRFQAWRAMSTKRLFVYLMVPEKLSETEWIRLRECGVQFFDDVPWTLHIENA